MGQINEFKIVDLNKICEVKVDVVKATKQQTALLIFVYDSENIHAIYQLLVWRDQERKSLFWRLYRNGEFSKIMRSIGELKELVGSYIRAEIDEKNLDDELMDAVARGEMTEDELKRIHNGGKDEPKLDNKGLAEFAKEEISKDPTCTALPSVLAGYGMPGSNPYLNQYNASVLAGKGEPPILTNEQVCERIAEGTMKKTKSGILLPN